MPAAAVWVLRAQVAVVYLMAGLAKLNHDWLVRGEPMATWLASRTDVAVVGPLLDEPWAGLVAGWAGAAFDLTIVGLAAVAAHAGVRLRRRRRLPRLTWLLFPIGVFPWVMLAGTLIFLPPDWPLRGLADLRQDAIWARFFDARRPRSRPDRAGAMGRRRSGAWAAVQLVIPLRHLAYPGDVRWTEEGYYGSFRVMLTEKTGWLQFEVTDPATGDTWSVRPSAVLTDWQERQAVSRADLTLAAAHLVADEMARRGRPGVEVRAESFVSFNGRRRQRMIDPTVDLAALATCAGLGVRPAARTADNGVMPSRRTIAVAVGLPVIAAVAVALTSMRGDGEPAAVELPSEGPVFESFDELVAASDAVVVATVAGVSPGRVSTAPGETDAGIRTRLVELSVERTLTGQPPTPLVVEEPAELLDGTPVVFDGMAPLGAGARADVVPRRRGHRRVAVPRRRQRPGPLRGCRRHVAPGRR